MTLRDNIWSTLSESFDCDNETITNRIMEAIEERIEEWRAGIDQAAEHGSEAATRGSNLLNDLHEALFEKSV